jgi:hypothetical protein
VGGAQNMGARMNISQLTSSSGMAALAISKIYTSTANIFEVNSQNSDKGGDYFVIDSDGNVGIGTTNPTAKLHNNGDLKTRQPVAPTTSDTTMLVDDSNTFYTNEGATGAVNFTLPIPQAGLVYEFFVKETQNVKITASVSKTIRHGANVTQSGGYIESGTVGNYIKMIAINSNE